MEEEPDERTRVESINIFADMYNKSEKTAVRRKTEQ